MTFKIPKRDRMTKDASFLTTDDCAIQSTFICSPAGSQAGQLSNGFLAMSSRSADGDPTTLTYTNCLTNGFSNFTVASVPIGPAINRTAGQKDAPWLADDALASLYIVDFTINNSNASTTTDDRWIRIDLYELINTMFPKATAGKVLSMSATVSKKTLAGTTATIVAYPYRNSRISSSNKYVYLGLDTVDGSVAAAGIDVHITLIGMAG